MEGLMMKRDKLLQEPNTASEALSKLETVRKSQNATRSYISDLKVQTATRNSERLFPDHLNDLMH